MGKEVGKLNVTVGVRESVGCIVVLTMDVGGDVGSSESSTLLSYVGTPVLPGSIGLVVGFLVVGILVGFLDDGRRDDGLRLLSLLVIRKDGRLVMGRGVVLGDTISTSAVGTCVSFMGNIGLFVGL